MMFKNRERIWVAGAGGQVGRDFVRLLEKAEEVELIPTDIGMWILRTGTLSGCLWK